MVETYNLLARDSRLVSTIHALQALSLCLSVCLSIVRYQMSSLCQVNIPLRPVTVESATPSTDSHQNPDSPPGHASKRPTGAQTLPCPKPAMSTWNEKSNSGNIETKEHRGCIL
ncbi:hypothetical protein K437DRAFT_254726, partial [Tilletiaria anomala UBC 951]